MTNQTTRVLELLKRFNANEKVCIEVLQNDELWKTKDGKTVSEKTIRRDLDVIKEIFPDSFELVRGGDNGCYKAITKEAFDNFMSKDMLSLMVRTFSIAQHNNIFSSLGMDDSDKRIIEKKIKEYKNTYEFKNKPFENSSTDMTLFKKLEQAIYHKKELHIEYVVFSKVKSMEVKPYKIIFMNENFYLACEVEHKDYTFSLFRVSKIISAEFTKRTFYQNREIVKFIVDMQTPLARYRPNYKEHLVEIMVEVSKSKAQYFKAKKHLASQKIIEEKDNGNLILSFIVTQTLEVEETIMKWIPHIRVVSPIALKHSIEDKLKKYISLSS